MAASDWDALMGSKAPERGHMANEGGKHDHWMEKELRSMEKAGEHSADERACRDGKAGMQGKKSPAHDIQERERGDASAKARNVDTKFEAEPFDVNQWDRDE